MWPKMLRGIFSLLIAAGLLSFGSFPVNAQATGSIYNQPVNPNGQFLLSAWLDPDGSDSDEYVWDNFTLISNENISEIDWYGVYDPSRNGLGGPVVDFRVRIYPSISGGSEPAVAGQPLVDFQTHGNAGETQVGMAGGAPLYFYTFNLPTTFAAPAGVKYWLQIEAYQHGTVPDWCWAAGSGGNSSHFWYGNLGGMFKYLTFSGDTAFTLLGSVQTFADVPPTHPYYQDIEILYANNMTGGCQTAPLKFCPDQIMNRGQAAAFMLRGNFGPSYIPPTPTHIFKDDWSKGTWAEGWAEGMRNEGFSAGCLTNPPKYCPWDQIPREQAVIFSLKLKYGKLYMPPPATGTLFADMTNPGFYATAWAEQAYKDGIINDCGTDSVSKKPKFCPKNLASRGLAAYMIVRAKNLVMP
jgi:hypothetical protein